MSIRIHILKTSTQINTAYDISTPKSLLPTYPDFVYRTTAPKIKEIIRSYYINNANSCEILESAENLTQTAIFKIPKKNTVVIRDSNNNGKFIQSHIEFNQSFGGTELERLYVGNEIMIDVGYDNNYQTRFVGFIREFKEESDLISFYCEDLMYKLKRSIELKKNFPKKYKPTSLNLGGVVVDVGGEEDFNLYHLCQWLIDSLYQYNQSSKKILVPRIRTYSTALGKIVMNTPLSPAEILQYLVKDMLNMKVYYRLEYLDNLESVFNPSDRIMEPVIYVGWGNWNELPYYDIVINPSDNTVNISDEKHFVRDTTGLKEGDIVYSYEHNFMYPYEYAYSDTYNPIVSNDLEWYNTDKQNLRITAKSFNTNNNVINEVILSDVNTLPYNFKTNEKSTVPLRAAELKSETYKKNQELLTETSTEIIDTNNLQDFNEVIINYPNLSVDELKLKIEEYINSYPVAGLKGSITVLGEPYIRQGDIVNLRINVSHIPNYNYYINDGVDDKIQYVKYYIKEVQTTFNDSTGIKQLLTLGNSVQIKN